MCDRLAIVQMRSGWPQWMFAIMACQPMLSSRFALTNDGPYTCPVRYSKYLFGMARMHAAKICGASALLMAVSTPAKKQSHGMIIGAP